VRQLNTTRFRRGRRLDGPVIAAHNRALALESEGLRLDPRKALRGVRAVLQAPRKGFYLLAERGGEVVGQLMITFEWSDWRDGVIWWIQSVYVPPAHRRQGVFRALLSEVRREARREARRARRARHRVCGLRLYVHRDNRLALAVYRALRFEHTPYLVLQS
jgi:GNAT superfamily N-acetyltransferase